MLELSERGSAAVYLRFEDTYVGEIAVILLVVKTEADHELIGYFPSAVVSGVVYRASGGLIEHSTGLYAVSSALGKIFYEMGKGLSAVDDILDDNEIHVLHIVTLDVEVYVDDTRGYGLSTV